MWRHLENAAISYTVFQSSPDPPQHQTLSASDTRQLSLHTNKHDHDHVLARPSPQASSPLSHTHLTTINMTRRIVYGISLWVFLGAAACTIASIALPNWISYHSPTDHDTIIINYGLHKRCSSITGECQPFPRYEDCTDDDRYFCNMWRSTGFLLNFSLMAELACVVAYVVILVGGRNVRESGWKILAGLLGLVAVGELIAMALVVSVRVGAAGVWRSANRMARRTFTTTTTASSSAGSLGSLGCFAR